MATPIDALLASGRVPDLARMLAAAAATHPDVPLFADDGWPEQPGPVHDVASFHAAAEHLAGQLWAAGVRPRQTVAVTLANHPRIQLAAFALHRIGAVPALLSVAMAPEHLVVSVRALHPAWTVLDSTQPWDAELLAAIGRHTELIDRAALPDPVPFPVGELRPDEVALITHTSGTTANPKLAAQSSTTIFQHAEPQIRLMREFGADRLALKSISCVHARACSAVQTALLVGQPLGFVTDERPESVAAHLVRLRPQSLEAHPNTYIRWESIVDFPDRPLASVARFSSTFDAMHPRTVRRMLSGTDVPDAFFLQAYGQTESGPVCARPMTRDDPLEHSTRVVGPAVEHREVRVVDDAGQPVPTGTCGYIEARAASQMVGYLGRESPAPEWWPMGDWGRLRADGALELLDRIVDRIPGVASTLVLEDELLGRFAELQEAVVLAGGPAGVHVLVVPKPSGTADPALVRKAMDELGVAVRDVRVLALEDLPMTGSKKVRRVAMTEELNR